MNKQKVTEQILTLISDSEHTINFRHEPQIIENQKQFNQNLKRISAAFSGSWLGYHAFVYYQGFQTPAQGDQFNVEWGFIDPFHRGLNEHWIEVSQDQVRSEIMQGVQPDYESAIEKISKMAIASFKDAHSSIISLIAVLIEFKHTKMLEEMNERITKIKSHLTVQELLKDLKPPSIMFSRDSAAASRGDCVPPHILLNAWHLSMYSPFDAFVLLRQEANTLLKYMEMHNFTEHSPSLIGSKIFIGHGRSAIWRELKDFLNDRLHLEWDEFNREPTAGLANTERLDSMLNHSGFALLVMTGEDYYSDDTFHARENVIHEVGLFQGKLGFRRAIVLLEDGCSEFSNIHGLSQIRFPKGNISASFEQIRLVLEREGVLSR